MNPILAGPDKASYNQLQPVLELVSNLPIPMFICGSDGQVIFCNPAMAEFIGLPEAAEMEFTKLHQFESLIGINLHFESNSDKNQDIKQQTVNFSDIHGNIKNGRLQIDCQEMFGNKIWCYSFIDDSRKARIEDTLLKKEAELSIFSQVASSLGSKLSFNEILRTILIAVSAREGLGFNRACLFFYRKDENCLKGHLAIGPSNPEEAGRIWGSIPDEGKSLREVLRQYTDTANFNENSLDRHVRNMNIPLSHGKYRLREVVLDKKPMIIREHSCSCEDNCDLCALMGVSEYAAVPMIARGKVLGVITADNHITGRAISQSSLAQLQIFANQAAIAIERANLYDSLAANLKELEDAHINLQYAQDEILKIERVSLWSELTNDIAHELRNPSSIIGGFAALMLKSTELPETLREQADIIYCESKRLDKAIEDVLDFSKSFSQERIDFDLVDVMREVLTIFQAKSTKNLYRLKPPENELNTMVSGRRDQVKYAVYSLVYLLEERLNDNCAINIDFSYADNNLKMILEISGCNSEVQNVLRDFANPKVGSQGLKLSMALESMRYNGGKLGIESNEDGIPGIYLECPSARSCNE